MSLLKTKPHYFPTAIATESGWINPVTKELLVSVGGLKSKLALEEAMIPVIAPVPVVEAKIAEVATIPEPIIETKEPIVMNETTPEVKTRKPYAPRKPKVIGEATENKLNENQQLIGEVVEYNLDNKVIGE